MPTFVDDLPPNATARAVRLPVTAGAAVEGEQLAQRFAESLGATHAPTYAARPDLTAEALLALCECKQRYDAERGSTLSTYAFARMRGRALDSLRREARLHRLRVSLRREVATVAADPPSITAQLDVRRAVEATAEDMATVERRILREVYVDGSTLAELARTESRWSSDQLHRAHQILLGRLRAKLSAHAPQERSDK